MRLVVIGCGSMGSNLALAMTRDGHSVSVIDEDPGAKALLGSDSRVRFVTGVAIDLTALQQAGVDKADGLAAVTGEDDTNLAVSMIARKRFKVPSVVARVFDPGKMQAYRSAGIHVVCPAAWGFRMIGDILTRPAREVAVVLGHGEVRIVALTVGHLTRGVQVKHISTAEIMPVAIVRNGIALVPSPSSDLAPGDLVYLRVPEDKTAAFERLVQGLEG